MSTIFLFATPVLVSLVAEFASWVNKKVSGTPLNGQGAFFATLVISAVGGAAYLGYHQIPSDYLIQLTKYTTIFLGGSQVVFFWIMKTVPGLDFGSTVTPVPVPAVPLVPPTSA